MKLNETIFIFNHNDIGRVREGGGGKGGEKRKSSAKIVTVKNTCHALLAEEFY